MELLKKHTFHSSQNNINMSILKKHYKKRIKIREARKLQKAKEDLVERPISPKVKRSIKPGATVPWYKIAKGTKNPARKVT